LPAEKCLRVPADEGQQSQPLVHGSA
jgi:hypothetical protein